jgi:hypothetical protein
MARPWPGSDGVSNSERLHNRNHEAQVILYAFDLLELDGEDLSPLPLEERKATGGLLELPEDVTAIEPGATVGFLSYTAQVG